MNCWPDFEPPQVCNIDLSQIDPMWLEAAQDWIIDATGKFDLCPSNVQWCRPTCGCPVDNCCPKCNADSPSTIPVPLGYNVVNITDATGDCLPLTNWLQLGNQVVSTDNTFFPNSVILTVQPNQTVPQAVQVAAATLALEFAKAACGDNTCALSAAASNVIREGVTYSDISLSENKTGIKWIDLLLSQYISEEESVGAGFYLPCGTLWV